MCCKIALDSDLPFPRSAFLTFPFEAYLDSPGRTQHDQRRLVPSALFPDKSDGLGKWSMLRILIKNKNKNILIKNKIYQLKITSISSRFHP